MTDADKAAVGSLDSKQDGEGEEGTRGTTAQVVKANTLVETKASDNIVSTKVDSIEDLFSKE